MGDRIVVQITDGKRFSPDFYGHWCGLEAVATLNRLYRQGLHNGIQSLMFNLCARISSGNPRRYSYYLYNHGEAAGMADWDNFTWCLDISTGMWSTTDPSAEGRLLTTEETDRFVRNGRPDLTPLLTEI